MDLAIIDYYRASAFRISVVVATRVSGLRKAEPRCVGFRRSGDEWALLRILEDVMGLLGAMDHCLETQEGSELFG